MPSAAKSAAPKGAPAEPAAASRPLKAGDHVFLVDGSGYIFRAYHALPTLTRKADASRRRLRQVRADLTHRVLSRLQGAPAGCAGRPDPPVPAHSSGGARL